MLHLAQVEKNDFSGEVELRLLARQQAEYTWAVIAPEDDFSVVQSIDNTASHLYLNQGLLVLVELSETNQVLSIREAKDWVLDMVRQYLVLGVTPEFLQREAERAEEWRQDLTLQSQELARRLMEMEARQEQIQHLEEDLKRQKKDIEKMAEEVKLQQQQLEEKMRGRENSEGNERV